MSPFRAKPSLPSGRPLAFAISMILAQQAYGLEFSHGDIDGSLNTQLSVGVSRSLENPDSDTIAVSNGGGGYSSASDDGKQNFKKGDTFSEIFKGNMDLSLNYENYGAFVRGKFWYDNRLKNGNVDHGHFNTGYVDFATKADNRTSKKLDDSGFDDLAKFSGAEILDAYVYGDFELGNTLIDARLGRQVVSWGESTFIRGGINEANPVDVSSFRRPGAEIKEGLMPVNMAYTNISLTDNLSLEAFYQLEWQKTVLDGCGTFFSAGDLYGGCDFASIGGNSPGVSDNMANTVLASAAKLERLDDRDPGDSGQFGIAARYYAAELNDTEFGAYFMNYHSRTPVLGGVAAPAGAPDFRGQYFLSYADDIRLYGLSFSTSLGDYSVSGEISYRPNTPVQINPVDMLLANLTGGAVPGLSPVNDRIQAVGPMGEVSGYDRLEVTQAQVTVVRFFEQVLGASRLTMLGEVGFSHTGSLPSVDEVRYGRAFTYGLGEGAFCNQVVQLSPTTVINGTASQCTTDGYVTSDSWGYRVMGVLEYNNVFAGINLKPKVAYSHDVNGYSANGVFLEGRQALTVGVGADYLNKYNASLSVTKYWGGEYNPAKDRDFAAFSLGVSF
ncbi:DUF1302 domain-containing protein [Parendozoicomonas haliclonae]|uniref:DUF1302 domain-containing protein n=1 Tax=Parendozoicomonas haliclonae TaxID=1960125 RepID=A0A1X7AKN6_9GAMM|nr:DUF1302 domain-containing protein [Parendozoicomonas haliclonae]SMA47514.1 hypothetical protein EHSB41UT_02442 [Parendozoicomonas haliclonae]